MVVPIAATVVLAGESAAFLGAAAIVQGAGVCNIETQLVFFLLGLILPTPPRAVAAVKKRLRETHQDDDE